MVRKGFISGWKGTYVQHKGTKRAHMGKKRALVAANGAHLWRKRAHLRVMLCGSDFMIGVVFICVLRDGFKLCGFLGTQYCTRPPSRSVARRRKIMKIGFRALQHFCGSIHFRHSKENRSSNKGNISDQKYYPLPHPPPSLPPCMFLPIIIFPGF